ncbi:hypothetical protein BGW38_009340 [Lunasporangiospora selenospora]|uniref:HORMA domain-containing protein n=1 Tax=Lunasporangiospora selenospora TaxID=979761 RepID=A0A9P6KG79_9FUNG|nr:hypothetical protein BGW38_009340 [Lunasporangiospora selenospora]
MLVTTDPQVKAHMREILRQVEAWLLECKVEKLIMAIKSKETMTVLERWQFDIHNTKDEQAVLDANMLSTGSLGSFSPPSTDSIPGEGSQTQTQTDAVRIPGSMTSALSLSLSHRQQQPKPEKTEKEIQSEIQAILRQITASVSFLPMLDEKCTWTILCQTERDVEVPATWSDADPHLVHNAEQVRLRSFSTNLHRVDAMVAYRLQDEL